MPTYEYACPECGIIEVFQSIKEDALKKCPTCKSPVERMISKGGGVIFKGSGFWETDYNRSDDYQKRSKQDSDAPPEPQTKTASKPEKVGSAPSSAPAAPSGASAQPAAPKKNDGGSPTRSSSDAPASPTKT